MNYLEISYSRIQSSTSVSLVQNVTYSLKEFLTGYEKRTDNKLNMMTSEMNKKYDAIEKGLKVVFSIYESGQNYQEIFKEICNLFRDNLVLWNHE